MDNTLKHQLARKLKQMAETPKAQIKRLAIGTLVSLITMIALVLTSDFASQSLFYALILFLAGGVIYAIPGYIGIWMWRMKDTLFREKETAVRKEP